MKSPSYLALIALTTLVVFGLWWFFYQPHIVERQTHESHRNKNFQVDLAPASSSPLEAIPLNAGSALQEVKAKLSIVVRDASERPLARVNIQLRHVATHVVLQTKFTQEDGTADFVDIPAGVYAYSVSAPMRPNLRSSKPIRMVDGENRSINLQLGDYQLGISGRVIDQQGLPVEGVALTASEYRSAHQINSLQLIVESSLEVITGQDGSFEISGLAAREYNVRSVADQRYASAKAIVRAGIEPLTLRVTQRRRLRITGQVTDQHGQPLAKAKVLSLNEPAGTRAVDASGKYEIFLYKDNAKQQYRFRFMAEGFRDKRLSLTNKSLDATSKAPLNVSLEPIGQTVVVEGVVRDNYGASVGGQQVQLYSRSASASYQVLSDENGAFSVAAVIPANDYKLWVHPQSGYRDYTLQPLDLGIEAAPLVLILQPLGTGRLTGRMINSQGSAVPGVSLWLHSIAASANAINVLGDADGRFDVDKVPAGSVVLGTRTSPSLNIEGIQVVADAQQYIELALDQGESSVTGQIIDQIGNPVGGARVVLIGKDSQRSLRSRSSRVTTSNDAGEFSFKQLAAWPRRLSVHANGYPNHHQILSRDVTLVEVRLASLEKLQ